MVVIAEVEAFEVLHLDQFLHQLDDIVRATQVQAEAFIVRLEHAQDEREEEKDNEQPHLDPEVGLCQTLEHRVYGVSEDL